MPSSDPRIINQDANRLGAVRVLVARDSVLSTAAGGRNDSSPMES